MTTQLLKRSGRYRARNEYIDSLAESSKSLINLNDEKKRFDELPDLKEKGEALTILNVKPPEWYDISKGHSHVGYQYADFARKLVGRHPVEKRSKDTNSIVDYFASLAILDNTISENVIAEMLKIKGMVQLKNGDKKSALKFFKHALAYNEKSGVKRQIQILEKKSTS